MPARLAFTATLLWLVATPLLAHDLAADNAAFVQSLDGPAVGPFLYLGAKHMFTGTDHLLFLLGVIFFLYRGRDILLYVTLFTIGHSITLFLGVWADWRVDEHVVDAIIGLSVVYKAFENMGGFEKLFGIQPDTRAAVLIFGLCHGLGLATKLQDYINTGDGLVTNLLSFNLGVELGQVLALSLILIALLQWRGKPSFNTYAFAANTVLMCAGFLLAGNQLAGYLFNMTATSQRSKIVLASTGALVIAAALLLTVVLPAEYGWDPLGTGSALGVMGMAETVSPALKSQQKPWHKDSIEFQLAPFESVEYKYRLESGDALLYRWHADGEVLFDMHAEPDGAAPGYAESFEKSQASERNGNYTASFSGIHGWFWQNRSQEDVTVTLQTRGFYSRAMEMRDGREFEHGFGEENTVQP